MDRWQKGIPGADTGLLKALFGEFGGRFHIYAKSFDDVNGSSVRRDRTRGVADYIQAAGGRDDGGASADIQGLEGISTCTAVIDQRLGGVDRDLGGIMLVERLKGPMPLTWLCMRAVLRSRCSLQDPAETEENSTENRTPLQEPSS